MFMTMNLLLWGEHSCAPVFFVTVDYCGFEMQIGRREVGQLASQKTSGCPWPSDTVKSPGSPSMSWKSCAKIEIPHLQIQAPKLRSQVLKTMSWKPYPKISQVFLGLGNPECKLQVSKNWGSHVLKIMSKKFPGLGLGNPHRVRPKTEISRLENHVLKNFMSRFWWTPPV